MPAISVIAVDWGTSRMRLWALAKDGSVVAMHRSDEGLEGVRSAGFDVVLASHLDAIGVGTDVPVIICGMAGSRQGWAEAPYVQVPSGFGGLAAAAIKITGISRDVRILPGMAMMPPQKADVMRGEETQLMGLGLDNGRYLVAMPGTHCKWVLVENHIVQHFSTSMTGELFAVLSRHSILRHSVQEGGSFNGGHPAFVKAAQTMLDAPQGLTGALFSVRAASLVTGASALDGSATLSGLLIGAEVGAVAMQFGTDSEVLLVGAGALGELYESVLCMSGIRFATRDGEELSLCGLTAAARLIWPNRF